MTDEADQPDPQKVRCPGCGLPQPLVAGALINHRALRADSTDCRGSGARRRTAAERHQDRHEWAQALATGEWSQVVTALRARGERDKCRPPALRDDPYIRPSAAEDDEPAVGDDTEQLLLFDPPK